jgi:hypothetical protein
MLFESPATTRTSLTAVVILPEFRVPSVVVPMFCWLKVAAEVGLKTQAPIDLNRAVALNVAV